MKHIRFAERNWEEIQKSHDSGIPYKELNKKFHIGSSLLLRAIKYGLLKKRNYPRPKHSEETKRRMSEKKKQWCLNNPDKLNWKKGNHFKSVPCEFFKTKLRESGIPFVEEYQPLQDRLFSLDIAFPDQKIGIEINGNQHYDAVGNLKPYYQTRHDLIVGDGWKLLELHFSSVWNSNVLQSTIKFITDNIDFSVSYIEYCKQKEERRRKLETCPTCGGWKHPQGKNCIKCSAIKNRKVTRPSKEELEDLVKKLPMTAIGKMFGVSDNAIRKWIKSYAI